MTVKSVDFFIWFSIIKHLTFYHIGDILVFSKDHEQVMYLTTEFKGELSIGHEYQSYNIMF